MAHQSPKTNIAVAANSFLNLGRGLNPTVSSMFFQVVTSTGAVGSLTVIRRLVGATQWLPSQWYNLSTNVLGSVAIASSGSWAVECSASEVALTGSITSGTFDVFAQAVGDRVY